MPGYTPSDVAIDNILIGELDYGDAPDSIYETLLASNGARHVVTGPKLGSERDIEVDGQPTASVDGDDNAGVPDDEDGVNFTTGLVQGNTVSVEVTISAIALLQTSTP